MNKCIYCGSELNINFDNIPNDVATLDTKCEKCGAFVKVGNPNFVGNNEDESKISLTDESLKKTVEEVIGNNDPFWNEPVFEAVRKIVEMPEGFEATLADITNYIATGENIGLKQQMDIYNTVVAVCNKIGIALEETKDGESAYLYKIKKCNSTSITLDDAKTMAEKELGCHDEVVINHIYETPVYYIFTAGIPGEVHVGASRFFYVNKISGLGKIVFMSPENRHELLEQIKESNMIL